MDVKITSVENTDSGVTVTAEFKYENVTLIKSCEFKGATKEAVEQWLACEAETFERNQKTADEITEKAYSFASETGLKAKK
jgi:hypothetical protein